MSFDQFNRLAGNHRAYDDFGNLTPNTEHSESHYPNAQWAVADWLPVRRNDKHFRDYFVVSSGQVVACDALGRVVPAGLKKKFAKTSGAVLTYTQTDVDELTTDLATGQLLTAATSYTRAQLTTALQNRGLIGASDNAEDYVGDVLGYAPYNYWRGSGGGDQFGFNPAQFKHHNYQLQHMVGIGCDYVMALPVAPASGASDSLDDAGDWVEAGDNVWYHTFASSPAKNTAETPMVLPSSAALDTEVQTLAEVSAAGRYLLDVDGSAVRPTTTTAASASEPETAPRIYTYSTSNPNTTFAAAAVVTYYTYDGTYTNSSTYACVLGDVKCGDLLTFDEDSNYTAFTKVAAADLPGPTSQEIADAINRRDEMVGQVLEIERHPKDLLDRVRTANTPALNTSVPTGSGLSKGTLDKMPGSATAGRPDKITYAQAADRIAIVNFFRR